jgi:DNA polymerase/3'-5' exonuclease PolX
VIGGVVVDNVTLANRLRGYARTLQTQGESLYRIRAYRRAADVIQALAIPVEVLVAEQGRKGLEALPGVGRHLSYTIAELIHTGEFLTVSAERAVVHPSAAHSLAEVRRRPQPAA